MRATRIILGAVGVLVGSWGAVELIRQGVANLVAATVWLLGGVVVHDGVLAPVAIAIAALGVSVLPRWLLPSAAAAAVVLGTVTIMAVPVLGRFGARADNATLLDRDYGRGWLVVAGLVLVCVVVGAVIARRNDAASSSNVAHPGGA
ncbi:hypothetical protein [Pengzhenrongella sicca]|uniref:Uncharacterized protein n=1 Tax=Pengzhenrongella sicca TaxID=2819238 RepID=A0A8A4ZGJ4_9MICO|nr:hypothetical protein [Pengzhenrongella sicca]QTE31014.1 hypothetical protein J4E96_08865 [Pengzhenrongella sicca]